MKFLTILTIVSIVIDSFPSAWSSPLLSTSSLSSLIVQHSATISTLQEAAAKYPDAPSNAVFYLRYCLGEENVEDLVAKLHSNLEWREGEGKWICTLAKAAVEAATSTDAPWDNTPVEAMAPHAPIVSKFITSSQCLTTATRRGDLLYIVRAGKINDAALMDEMTLEEMTDYFLYCREVNSIVANDRSVRNDRLVSVISLNDLTGVKLIGGDARFRNALSATSARTTVLYPGLSGPTLLLNLPRLVGALIQLFMPLFPKEVRKKVIFAQGPMRDVSSLRDISVPGTPREKFMNSIDELIYSDTCNSRLPTETETALS